MSESTKKSTIGKLETLALGIFIIAIILIFVSRSRIPDRDREIHNALRYQHVSGIADALWQTSFKSTDFERLSTGLDFGESCRDKKVSVQTFEDILVPNYFETLPEDPGKGEYFVFVGDNQRITVCAFGENEDKTEKYILITR